MAITNLLTLGSLRIVEVDSDPTAGLDLPVGSLVLWNNGGVGQLFLKAGAGLTEWNRTQDAAGVGSANQILGVNNAGTANEYKTLSGTANRVTVTNGAGTITLSGPQDIHTGASPTFVGATLSSFASDGLVHNNASGVLSTSLLVDADVAAGAAIARSKLANGTANHVVINNGSGAFTSEATLAISRGGTALSSVPTNGQLLIGNGTNYTLANLTGTTNQISVTNGIGSITLATPQNIHNAATPTFAGLTLSSFTSNGVVHNNASGVLSSSLIVNADIDASAAIARSKIATGTASHVIVNDGSGNLSSIATLNETRGGTNQTTYTTGDILYASGANTLSKLAIGSANQVLQVSGGLPVWQTLSASGITTLNTLTAATQTFATGTSGTDFNISSATSTHTFNIPDASGTNRGVITTGAQTIAGAKTFSSAVTINPTTNQIVLGVTNTTTITSPAPAASRIYTIPDAGGAASFVMTESSQTINGTKTFGVAALFADGTAAAPGVSFSADTNSGIYRIGADSFGFAANGTNIATVTSAGVVVNNTTLNASAVLQADSTTLGFLMPRMTSTQRLAIASPAQGLQVFDTDLDTVCEYNGTTWKFEYRQNTTAIQSSTSTTYANITELVSVSLETGLYVLELKGIARSTALGTGVGFRLAAGTATISQVVINWAFSQAAAGTDKNFEYSQTATGDNVTSASVVTANADFPIRGDGVFTLSGAGTVAIQIRSETGTSISIRPNSTLMIKKVG